MQASMRPRVFPAEDQGAETDVLKALRASMRPRVFPAEDCRERSRRLSEKLRFNEAAGIPRGRPTIPASSSGYAPACFNEAAGIPRGRLGKRRFRSWPRRLGFNEAAGIPRGRPLYYEQRDMVVDASMRPRVFPAEDVPRASPCVAFLHRFNEAAGIPRGRHTLSEYDSAGAGVASMRPRVFPAEDTSGKGGHVLAIGLQ